MDSLSIVFLCYFSFTYVYIPEVKKLRGFLRAKRKEGESVDDHYYMQFALDLAKKTKGQTSPNPVVGAVVVKDGRIIGIGTHLKAGEPHAEVHALNMAGKDAEGSTIYVTLEPCSHYGRTPPCAERIIKEKVNRVVIATLDPNPLVSGNGANMLREAGVDVTVGVFEEEARQLNEFFNKYITTRQPFVTVKTAMTLDGKIATYTGDSRWITGESSRKYVHQLRHEHDAILVGIGTVLQDDPQLSVRTEQPGLNPIRVVIDSMLRIPLNSKLVTDKQAPTWIFTTKKAPESKLAALKENGIPVIQTTGEDRVSLKEVLKYLGEKQITSVFVEGGSAIIGSLFDEQLVDRYIGFIAPKIVGGKAAKTTVGGKGISLMSQATTFKNIELKQFDQDLCLIGEPNYF